VSRKTDFDVSASTPSAKRIASVLMKSARVSTGLLRNTQVTCWHSSDSTAARRSVDLPVPASPSRIVSGFREPTAYRRLLSASR